MGIMIPSQSVNYYRLDVPVTDLYPVANDTSLPGLCLLPVASVDEAIAAVRELREEA